jgi:hypothetical protein
MTTKERWDIARGVIEHEHSLVSQRLTALLTLQGFLFASSAVAMNVAAMSQHPVYRNFAHGLVAIMAVAGAISPWFAHGLLRRAQRQARLAGLWWFRFGREDNVWAALTSPQEKLPPIQGLLEHPYLDRFQYPLTDEEKGAVGRGQFFSVTNLPILLFVVWLLVLAAAIASWALLPQTPSSSSKLQIEQTTPIRSFDAKY